MEPTEVVTVADSTSQKREGAAQPRNRPAEPHRSGPSARELEITRELEEIYKARFGRSIDDARVRARSGA